MFGDLTTPKYAIRSWRYNLFQSCTVEMKAVSMRSVIVNSHHPNTSHLSACLQQVGHATAIASGHTYKWSHDHGVPFDHSGHPKNLAPGARVPIIADKAPAP